MTNQSANMAERPAWSSFPSLSPFFSLLLLANHFRARDLIILPLEKAVSPVLVLFFRRIKGGSCALIWSDWSQQREEEKGGKRKKERGESKRMTGRRRELGNPCEALKVVAASSKTIQRVACWIMRSRGSKRRKRKSELLNYFDSKKSGKNRLFFLSTKGAIIGGDVAWFKVSSQYTLPAYFKVPTKLQRGWERKLSQ